MNGSAVPAVAYRARSGATVKTTAAITATKRGARTSRALRLNSYATMAAAYRLRGNVTPKTIVVTVRTKATFALKKRVPISK